MSFASYTGANTLVKVPLGQKPTAQRGYSCIIYSKNKGFEGLFSEHKIE